MWPNRMKSFPLHKTLMQLCNILNPISGLPSCSLLVFTMNRLLYFSSSSAVPRPLTSSISSHLRSCAHTEIRRPTVISTVMLQCKHQQLSLKSQQTSFCLFPSEQKHDLITTSPCDDATGTRCHFSMEISVLNADPIKMSKIYSTRRTFIHMNGQVFWLLLYF